MRKGNPKVHIKDWNDLTKDGVLGDYTEPENQRRSTLNFLAAYAFTALKANGGDETKAKAYRKSEQRCREKRQLGGAVEHQSSSTTVR